jgi:glycosyltransferase involved in cell wall biosynthesis
LVLHQSIDLSMFERHYQNDPTNSVFFTHTERGYFSRYPSPEPRHLHYSPLEAMVVGTPVLDLEGGLIDRLAGTRLPGACANVLEMKTKARRLIEGDRALAEAMRSNQARVLETFAPEVVKRQWAAALFGGAQSS